MPCYRPIPAWRSANRNSNDKRPLVHSMSKADPSTALYHGCGQCIGCRLDHARQWSVRCVHEAQMHKQNCFITLTFNEGSLHNRKLKAGQSKYSVYKRDFQLFMKRLRKAYDDVEIRVFYCGEYGKVCRQCFQSEEKCKNGSCSKFYPSIGRPHYHALLFGFDFPDKQLYKQTPQGNLLYTSPALGQLWPYGFAPIGGVSFQSAGYVARYAMKKLTGPAVEKTDKFGLLPYQRTDPHTGELHTVEPEFIQMSRMPGLGNAWFEKYWRDVYPRDYVTIDGFKQKPPRYYDDLLKKKDPMMYYKIKRKRLIDAKNADIEGSRRLRVKENVKLASIQSLSRNLEKGM